MKPLTFIVLCTSLLLVASFAYAQSDEICFTWVNKTYVSDEQPQKIIFNYDGTFETYEHKDANDPLLRGVFQVIEQWKDSEGIIWYKLKTIDMSGTELYLIRISNEGDRLEFVHKPHEYPERIEEKASSYCTYTRTSID